ncbi:MAG TPA: YIP1 family protein [Candidatus Binataceae bacterium]|nr:YIP1 family protein [Candidatus Binataceae bacterium]
MAQSFGERITPYLTIWTEPHATIRRIVETDPERNVKALAALSPALAVLEREWMTALEGPMSAIWPIRVLFEVVIVALFGIAFLYIDALFITWIARALGGTGGPRETRTALAWGKIPAITASAASILALLSGAMAPPEIGINGLPKMTPPTFEFGGMHTVLGLWGFIVVLKGIGEVHQISAWRALLAELIVLIAFALVITGMLLALYALMHGAHR